MPGAAETEWVGSGGNSLTKSIGAGAGVPVPSGGSSYIAPKSSLPSVSGGASGLVESLHPYNNAPSGSSSVTTVPASATGTVNISDPVSEARQYLISVSTGGGSMKRQGYETAIGRLNPAYVLPLATAIRNARAEGIPAGVYSAYRARDLDPSGYAFWNRYKSTHVYGIGSDISGIGGPGSKTAKRFHEIATDAGIFGPYGPNNYAEFNHFQAVPMVGEQFIKEHPALKESVSGTGPKDLQKMWELSGLTLPTGGGLKSYSAVKSADGSWSVPDMAYADAPDPFGVQHFQDVLAKPDPLHVYKNGDKAPEVANWQSMLSDLGYYKGKVDAWYGPKTRDAIKQFQADNGLKVDGVLGIGPRAQTGPALVAKHDATAPSITEGRSELASASSGVDAARAAIGAPYEPMLAPSDEVRGLDAPFIADRAGKVPAAPGFSVSAPIGHGVIAEVPAPYLTNEGWIPTPANPYDAATKGTGEADFKDFMTEHGTPVSAIDAVNEEAGVVPPKALAYADGWQVEPHPDGGFKVSPATKTTTAAPTAVADAFGAAFEGSKEKAPATSAAPAAPVADDPFSTAFGGAEAKLPANVTAGKVQSVNSDTSDPGQVGARGIIRGLPVVGPLVDEGATKASAFLHSLVKGTKYEDELATMQAGQKAADIEHPDWAAGGEFAGQALGYTGAAVAAPVLFGAEATTLPGAMVTSGLTNTAVSGMDAVARGEDPYANALAGGVAGTFAPAIGHGVAKLLSSHVAADIAALADKAVNKFKIPLSADLLSSNPMVRFAHSVVERTPFSGGAAAREGRQLAFNRAVAKSMGETADALTPQTMAKARTRIGRVFDSVAQRTPSVGADQQFGQELNNTWQEAGQVLTKDEMAPIENQIKNVLGKFDPQTGTMTGEQYQALTRRGTPLDRATQSQNPNIRFYAGRVKEALDGALERSAPQDVVHDLRTARSQWKAMKTVEDLAEKAPTGNVSPALLMGAVRRSYSNMAYGQQGDLIDLARIGQVFLKEAPSSGTAERSLLIKGGVGLGEIAAGGGAGALALHHPLAAVIGAGAPFVAARAAKSILGSRALINSLIRGGMRGSPNVAARAIRYVAPAAMQIEGKPRINRLLRDYSRP